MLKAKIKAKKIRELVDIIELMGSEMKLKTLKKGFEATMVDPTKIAMIQLNLKDKAFEEYSTDEAEFAIDLQKIQSILKLASGDTIISFEYNDKEKEHLIIRMENLRRMMRLNDPFELEYPHMPDLTLPGLAILPTSELIKGVKAANSISDHLYLTISEKEFELTAEGDTDEVSLKLNKDLLTELKSDKKHSSMFSIEFLLLLIKKASENITLHLGSNKPVRIEYSFADDDGECICLLAPRIDKEE